MLQSKTAQLDHSKYLTELMFGDWVVQGNRNCLYRGKKEPELQGEPRYRENKTLQGGATRKKSKQQSSSVVA